MGRAGMLGFFGAAGLSPQRVEQAIDRLRKNLGDIPHGFNLIHSPNEPDLEAALVDLDGPGQLFERPESMDAQ